MKKTSIIAAILPGLALAGCVSPTARVAAKLQDAGLKPRMANCMAQRLVDRLSRDELHQLAALPKATRAASLEQALDRLRGLDDPHLVHVTLRAALVCATQ